MDSVTPSSQRHERIEPFYPKLDGAGRPPIELARMLRIYVGDNVLVGLIKTHSYRGTVGHPIEKDFHFANVEVGIRLRSSRIP